MFLSLTFGEEIGFIIKITLKVKPDIPKEEISALYRYFEVLLQNLKTQDTGTGPTILRSLMRDMKEDGFKFESLSVKLGDIEITLNKSDI